MSQILLPSERDLGMMVSYEPQRIKSFLHHIKLDLGLFNGQGLSGSTDFDSRKDVISRLYVKPFAMGRFHLSGGLSILQGGWRNATKYIYEIKKEGNGLPYYSVDSSLTNQQKIAPRKYQGADLQVKMNHSQNLVPDVNVNAAVRSAGVKQPSCRLGSRPTPSTAFRVWRTL